MPIPSKSTNTAKKSEKPKDAGRFITASEGWKIAQVAKSWVGTPYAPVEKDGSIVPGSEKYAGSGAVKDKGADCSGSTWKIYAEAGFLYGPYTNTALFVNRVASEPDFIRAWFQKLVGSDENFIKGTHFFKQVSLPQVGDIGWWHNGKTGDAAAGHMVVYDINAGTAIGKGGIKLPGNCWSARNKNSEHNYGPSRVDWHEKTYNALAKWYRYWKPGSAT